MYLLVLSLLLFLLSMISIVIYYGAVARYGFLGLPGYLGGKPIADPEIKKKKLNAELANGRLAMMAIIGMFFQALKKRGGLRIEVIDVSGRQTCIVMYCIDDIVYIYVSLICICSIYDMLYHRED